MSWSRRHAERLLWRAGFGGRPKEIDYWARRSRTEMVDWLIRGGRGPHGTAKMVGAAPRTKDGGLDPTNEWGHDVLWWLDRMVRSQRPLQEKMTLFWHDHFATREQDTPLMLAQNRMMRKHALGHFGELLTAMTTDPALASFLSLLDSNKRSPNENYARELMELFTLGVGNYSEKDVREAARALTGFVSKHSDQGLTGMDYDPDGHDDGAKTLLGRSGKLDWRDVLTIVVAHPAHATFLIDKLWGFFVTEPLDPATRSRLVKTYRDSNESIAAVVRAILVHPKLYADLDTPSMVKSPVVQVAGLLRQVGRPIDTADWSWILQSMGQVLFSPPSVAGWDWGPAWLSTSTMRGRFTAAAWVTRDAPVKVTDKSIPKGWSAKQHLAAALKATGRPHASPATERRLLQLVRELKKVQYSSPEATQAAVRNLLLAGPDAQVH